MSIELNREYIYKQICEELGWKVTTGESKQVQIKEIESCFEFIHPLNKKTKKIKKSYIFTKQIKEPINPSANHGGVRNTKNISSMMKYIQSKIDDRYLGNYYSFGKWYTKILDLLDDECSNIVYKDIKEIEEYCKVYHIEKVDLLKDYVSKSKTILKDMFIKSLSAMEKLNLCEYEDGYKFIYKINDAKIKKRFGNINTSDINDEIISLETDICEALKYEFGLSKKLKGRQLLMQIYNNGKTRIEFDYRKINSLMENNSIVRFLNKVASDEYGITYQHINKEHPIENYYRAIKIASLDFEEYNTNCLKNEIITIIKDKTRKVVCNKKYNYIDNEKDVIKIENLLFTTRQNTNDNIDIDLIDDELNEIFDI